MRPPRGATPLLLLLGVGRGAVGVLVLQVEVERLYALLNVVEEGGLPELLVLPDCVILDDCVGELKERNLVHFWIQVNT